MGVDGDEISIEINFDLQIEEQKLGSNNATTAPKDATSTTGEDATTTTDEKDESKPKPTITNEDESKQKPTSSNEISPPTPTTTYVVGQIYIAHVSRPSIAFCATEGRYEVICPACSLDIGKAYQKSSYCESHKIVLHGVHVENQRVLEQPNVKPLSTPVSKAFHRWVTENSIIVRGPPSYGFDMICPKCTFELGYDTTIAKLNKIMQGKHIH